MAKSIDDSECRLQIGDFSCSLNLNKQSYASYLKKYYRGFLTRKKPHLDIRVDVVSRGEVIALPDSILLSKKVDGRSFNFHSGLIKGRLDLDEKLCQIAVKEALFKRIRIFEHFLFQTYYTLLQDKGPEKSKSSFLLHGCAVEKDGIGFLFTGPSESGKSTIARLSSKYTVLGDEIILIEKTKGAYSLRSTPFRGDYRENENTVAHLNAVFLITHGSSNEIVELKKREFATRFLKEVIYPGTLLSEGRKEEFNRTLDFSTQIADEVPFYELRFLPEEGFWSCINNELTIR